MSSVPTARDLPSLLARSSSHQDAGDRLKALDDEWFAVCYFYSAYHMVKAAMLEDPIFDDIARCAAVHRNLSVDSRFTTHHSGGLAANGRSLGMNEIVMKLYKPIRVPYTRLHAASVAVRYGKDGLGEISPISVNDDYVAVCRAYGAGLIVAPN